MKKCGIYKITSPIGRIYIGQSIDIDYRFKKYRLLSGGLKSQTRLYRSLLKYGHETHIFEIIEICKRSELNDKEKAYIKKFNSFDSKNGLNLTSGGGCFNMSLETRKKISDSSKNRSIETRKKISISKIGNKNMLGKKHTQETKDKISLKKTGSKQANETIEKRRLKLTGLKRSNEICKKFSDSMQRAKILNTETGEIYIGYNSIMPFINMKKTTFIAQLTGQNKNKTKYKLL